MKIAVMQPYFLPYIGYFQLIAAVDRFVVFDDVNYINRGWINRNRILLNNKAHFITLPLSKAGQNRLINKIEIAADTRTFKKILNTLRHAYGSAPFFKQVYSIIEKIFFYNETNLSEFIIYSLKTVCDYLGINTKFFVSSRIDHDKRLRGREKILAICKILDASHYINPIGGMDLYQTEDFQQYGIKLSFLKTDRIAYKQFGGGFVPDLSIIDVLMFNSKDRCRDFLQKYRLVKN